MRAWLAVPKERTQVASACLGKDPAGDKLRGQLLQQLETHIAQLTKSKQAKCDSLLRLSSPTQATEAADTQPVAGS